MAAKRKSRIRRVRPRIVGPEVIDATPERIARAGGDSELVNAAEIDPGEQAINLVRRFRDTMLDRLYRRDRLTLTQWTAGDIYRRTHAASVREPSVCGAYGERSGSGEPNYGLPATEAQIKARDRLREMRDAFPRDMQGFMDRFLVRDALPRYGGRAHMRQVRQIAEALEVLAGHLAGQGRRR